jgi:hypothetical protein
MRLRQGNDPTVFEAVKKVDVVVEFYQTWLPERWTFQQKLVSKPCRSAAEAVHLTF